jgi:hypothetical protein
MFTVAPIGGIPECGNKQVTLPGNASTTMIEMQMREEDIRYIIGRKSMLGEGTIESVIPMEIIVTEEFRILLVSHAIVYEYQSLSIFDQQTTKRPAAHIILIGGIDLVPDALRYNAKHGAAVEFEMPGVYRI